MIQLLFLGSFLLFIHQSIGNEVLGEPFVNCAADAIYIKAKTSETFIGHISVRFAPNNYCYQVLVTNNQIEVLIPHQDCALTRKRLHSPDGVLIIAEMVVSFHPDFLTKDDRVYRFECLHTRTENGKDLGKGAPTTEAVPMNSDAPKCEYNILRSMGGRPIHSVAIGDIVFHEWNCENTKGKCLFVRNCHFVTPDSKYPLLNENGCTLDQYVLPELKYFNETMVGQNVSVFGVSQKPIVYFECELVLIGKKKDGSCPIPECGEKKRTRRSIHPDSVIEVQSQRLEVSELRRTQTTVHQEEDIDPSRSPSELAVLECVEESSINQFVCLTTTTFILSTVILTVITLTSLTSTIFLLFRRGKYTGVRSL